MTLGWWEWLAAAVLGAIIGAASIVSRYRDEPDDALFTFPAAIYMLIHALASLLALLLIHIFGWTFGASDPQATRWLQILVAGLGAMTVMRLSLPFKLGDETISIGLDQFLEGIFNAVDRSVDRKRGEERARIVNEKMRDVSFKKACIALPAYCFALLQNLPQVDQELFAKRVALIRDIETSPRVKSYLLGLSLLNLVGDEILAIGIDTLGDEIKDTGDGLPDAVSENQ